MIANDHCQLDLLKVHRLEDKHGSRDDAIGERSLPLRGIRL